MKLTYQVMLETINDISAYVDSREILAEYEEVGDAVKHAQKRESDWSDLDEKDKSHNVWVIVNYASIRLDPKQ